MNAFGGAKNASTRASSLRGLSTRPAIKFCGLTQAQDVANAVKLGVDAIGLVFYPPSPRAVTVEQAIKLVKAIPVFITVVALVVNLSEQELVALAKQVPFDVIQFHGDESPLTCQQMAKHVGKRWIKAIRVREEDDEVSILLKINELYDHGASGVLLDLYHPDKFGGTGERFDWGKLPKNSPLPMILAGGLTADNVAQACELPIYGVDVSGGIESQKGVKDLEKMMDFVKKLTDR